MQNEIPMSELEKIGKKCLQFFKIEEKIAQRRREIYYKKSRWKGYVPKTYEEIIESPNFQKKILFLSKQDKDMMYILMNNKEKITFALDLEYAILRSLNKEQKSHIAAVFNTRFSLLENFFAELLTLYHDPSLDFSSQGLSLFAWELEFANNPTPESYNRLLLIFKEKTKTLEKLTKKYFRLQTQWNVLLKRVGVSIFSFSSGMVLAMSGKIEIENALLNQNIKQGLFAGGLLILGVTLAATSFLWGIQATRASDKFYMGNKERTIY